MKILGTLTVDTPNALDKVTDLNADLLDGKSSELFLSKGTAALTVDGRFAQRDADSSITSSNLDIQLAYEKDFVIFTAPTTPNPLNQNYENVTNSLTIKSTGRVGIGRADPSTKLHLHLTAAEKTAGLTPFIVSNSADTALFQIDHNGKVSIGKSTIGESPTNLLNIFNYDIVSSGGLSIKNSYTVASTLYVDVLTLNMNGSSGSNNAELYTNKKLNINAANGTTIKSNTVNTLFDIDSSGRISIGGVADSSVQFRIIGTSTTTGTGNRLGIYNNLTYDIAADTIIGVYGLHTNVTVTGTGSLTSVYGLYVGTTTVTGVTVTGNKYGIYQAGVADSNVFNGAATFSNNLTASGTIAFTTTTNTIGVGHGQTTGALTLGGTTQTGTITLGQSTSAQTLNIGTGAIASGTKAINIGTNGVSGSTTTIIYGSPNGTTHTFNGNVAFPIGTNTFIGQTKTTAHLLGNVGSVGIGIDDGGDKSGVFVNNTFNGTYSSQDIRFLTAEGGISGATERMRITPNGMVGVGITPSSWSTGKVLEIGNTGNAIWGNSTANMWITENTYYNSGWKYASANPAATYQLLTNRHIWSIAPTGTINTTVTFTQAMTLSGNGNLLIGKTTDDGSKLQVQGIASINAIVIGTTAGSSTTISLGTGASAQISNTAFGTQALSSNTTANRNTAIGYLAGKSNTTGHITALGAYTLTANTTGTGNVAIGGNDEAYDGALQGNITGNYNTAVGVGALANSTLSKNTAVGYSAGRLATTGDLNTFIGAYSGSAVVGGYRNTFIGCATGASCVSGSYNTYIGVSVGDIGAGSVMTGSKNTIIGGFSGNQNGLDITTLSNHIVLSDGDSNPRIIVNAGGNVGINQPIPTEKLHVVGNILATGTVIGSNISNSYYWALTVTGTATTFTTNVVSVDSYGTGFSGVIFKLRQGDGVAGTNLAPNSIDLTYKNVFVYRSTVENGTTFEQVFPDIEISSVGRCTLTFATAQTNYIFRIIFA